MGTESTQQQRAERHSSKRRERAGGALWRWVCFSGLLHTAIIWSFFFFPQASSRGAISYPVYTVDLVGGEKIGGGRLDVGIKPAPASKKKAKKVKKKISSRSSKKKKVKKVKPRTRVESLKKKRKKKSTKGGRKKVRQKARKKVSRRTGRAVVKKSKKTVDQQKQTESGLSDQVRDKLIQAALERVKQRAELEKDKENKGGLGPEEVQGAAAPGKGGRGGGIVKGVEFLIYRNRMLYLIKERWTWVGKRTDLEVTVQFGIRENGEIVRLKVVDASEDPSYDDSVLRAVRRASPLPPTPDDYRKDFMNVELTFRPGDLSG